MTPFPTLDQTGQTYFQSRGLPAQSMTQSILYAQEIADLKPNLSRTAEFLAGRKAASDALAKAGCRTARTCYIGRDRFGAPAWPAGWIGSISHAQDTFTAIAARQSDYLAIGIDVEAARGGHMDKAIARICTVDGDDTSVAPTLIFSAKEAIYKACHPIMGGNIWFTDFTISYVAPEGTFHWQFNPNPAVTGQGLFQITDTGVLTCVALRHDHALATYVGRNIESSHTTPQKDFAE